MPNLSDVPHIQDAYDYIKSADVRAALGHLVLLAKAHGRPVRPSSHGYMQRAYTFAPRGTGHPAVSVNRHSLTLYLGPKKKRSIQRVADVPEDLFDGPQI